VDTASELTNAHFQLVLGRQRTKLRTAHVFVCVCVCVCVCVDKIYTYMHTYMYIHTYICMYVYIHSLFFVGKALVPPKKIDYTFSEYTRAGPQAVV
jgi:hypothetical protein